MKAKTIYASTRAEAARLGMKFFRNEICRNNHTDEDDQPELKSVHTGNCIQCQAESRQRATERIRKAMHAARPLMIIEGK